MYPFVLLFLDGIFYPVTVLHACDTCMVSRTTMRWTFFSIFLNTDNRIAAASLLSNISNDLHI